MEFKDRLKLLRQEKNITATQLAASIDKGESAVRMWEIGRSKPDADTLIKIANYFDCSVDFLLGLDEFKNKKMIDHALKEYKEFDRLLSGFSVNIRQGIIKIAWALANVCEDIEDETGENEIHADVENAFLVFVDNLIEEVRMIPGNYICSIVPDIDGLSDEEIAYSILSTRISVKESASRLINDYIDYIDDIISPSMRIMLTEINDENLKKTIRGIYDNRH